MGIAIKFGFPIFYCYICIKRNQKQYDTQRNVEVVL